MPSMPKCVNCGESSYEKRSGVYICDICDTQSWDVTEEHCDTKKDRTSIKENTGRDVETVVSSRTDETVQSSYQGRNITSWEQCTSIIRGTINELVNLGAPEDVKIVAIQIWAVYLKTVEAAFTSTKVNKFPKLPLAFKEKDAEILYGVRRFRNKLIKNVINLRDDDKDYGSDSTVTIPTDTSSSVKEEPTNLKLEVRNELNQAVNSADVPPTREKKRLKLSFTEEAGEKINWIKGSIEMCKKLKPKDRRKRLPTLEKLQSIFYSHHSTKRKERITIQTLISVIRLSLYIVNSDIQLGDIIRWITEGRLPLHKPECFGDSVEMTRWFSGLTSTRRSGFEDDICSVANSFNIEHVPTPNLYKLAERYCTELQLPDDFLEVVYSIMNLEPPQMNYSRYRSTAFPDYECRVLGYIVYAAKLLFGLNNITEERQSTFATLFNSMCPKYETKLFCWKEWVRYMECRKITLAKYDIMYNYHCFKGTFSGDIGYFPKHWNKIRSQRNSHTSKFMPNRFKNGIMNMTDVLQGGDTYSNENLIEFPVSLTPQTSSLEYLLKNHKNVIPKQSRKLLRQEFTSTTIRYTIDDKWYSTAVKDNTNVSLDDERPVDMDVIADEYNIPIFNFGNSCTQRLPGHASLGAIITPSSNDKRKKGKMSLKSQVLAMNKIRWEILTDPDYDGVLTESKAELKSTLTLCRPSSYYWFHHHIFGKMTNEEFYDFCKSLPPSFVWFLEQCSVIVSADIKDIYTQLAIIESTLYRSFSFSKYDGLKLITKKQEW